jgi:hypothetical protein
MCAGMGRASCNGVIKALAGQGLAVLDPATEVAVQVRPRPVRGRLVLAGLACIGCAPTRRS